MRFGLRFLMVLAALLTTHGTCAGKGTVVAKPGATSEELGARERQAFLAQASSNYPQYRNLRVSFTLRGKVDGQELYYEGSLSADKEKLTIKMTDAVFLSPLLTLSIGADQVTLRDHARNKTETIARSDYQWVELFGRSFPVRFFEPLMRGYLPDDVVGAETHLSQTAGGETMARANNNAYEAALYFQDARLQKIFYRDKVSGEILVFMLRNFFKNRNYPQSMRIEHSRRNDFLQLDFKSLRIS